MSAVSCFADIMPSSSTSISHYGMGVLNLPDCFVVYSKPDMHSPVIKQVNLIQPPSAIISQENPVDNMLIVNVPSTHLALATVETNQEDGWFEINYNQKTGQTGWVKMQNLDNFMTWKEFLTSWGKSNGLYFFKDTPDSVKKLYSQDSADSQTVESFTYAKYITFSMIRGNWMLVTVLDLGNSSKIGWIQWRRDDGKLYLFPNLK